MFKWLFSRFSPAKGENKNYSTPESQQAAERAVKKETEQYQDVMTNSTHIEGLVAKLKSEKDTDIDYFGYLIEASMWGKIDAN